MSSLKRSIEIGILVVVLPLALLFWAGIFWAFGVQAILLCTGLLLGAWIFSAIAVPMLFGAISPGEIVDGYRSRRRHERFYEGEPLGGPRQGYPFWKGRF
jgi:hypothetical protein